MPDDFEETRRTADHHSPITGVYDFPTIMNQVLGRESATCEACGETVDPNAGGGLKGGEPFVIWELVENVYIFENLVLLCHTCINRPDDEWRANVRAKRARERDHTPTWTEHVAHWLSDPRSTALFARRVAGTVAGLVAVITLITALAGIAGSFLGGVATGVAWGRTVIATVGAASSRLTTYPWLIGALFGVGYTAHAVERLQYDPRGYVSREPRPWVPLTVAGGIAGVGALGLLAVVTTGVPAPSLVSPIAGIVWAVGAAGVAWYIDLALRHDLKLGLWRPNRGAWMVAGRVGLLPGLLAISVGLPFANLFADSTTGVLAAIPAAVALGFAGRRLPYDPSTRDRILDRLPNWLLEEPESD